MTIKEICQQTGLTSQAVYKRIKAHGIDLKAIRDKATGQFTEDGEAKILALFDVTNQVEKLTTSYQPIDNSLQTEVEKLRNQVEKLTTEVECLKKLQAEIEGERDYLRQALSNSQQLQALTASKVPPALPAPEKPKWWGWFNRRKEKDGNE